MQFVFMLDPDYASLVFGYIDPGTGSLLIQFAIGLIIAVGASVKIYWRRIKMYFNKNNRLEENNDD